jgi:DNA-binding LytR/AlgR family response regulator
MLNCLIVDDEKQAHEVLKNYINKVENLTIVGHAFNAIEATNILRQQQIDILFLDINMPEITGLELLQTLTILPKVILTTAYSEFALDAFDAGVSDYLMKPIPFTRFLKAINKITQDNSTNTMEDVSNIQSISLKVDGIKRNFNFEDILYFQSLGNYIKVYTNTKSYLTIMTLNDLQNEVGKHYFTRIHKSYLVPNHSIKNADNLTKITIGKTEIPIGRTYKQIVQNIIG